MSISQPWYITFARFLVRLFTRRVIVALPADERREHFPFGLTIVAVNARKTEWTIVEGFRSARVDRGGVWYMPEVDFGNKSGDEPKSGPSVFTLSEAKDFVARLAAVGEAGAVQPSTSDESMPLAVN